ncbi:hypothetical protein NEMIN01_0827 [Nematocida minor]|uniref:uncharacterized protein n=1 Tax=Nematocida minor TaxID=1912983 RepID=UPI00221EBF26|nr:uncharacterized protein NEMIN01_0827 [Nematocida minor]KAI5190042.1 hypothetical protein NEMIN01_0827 [Nematocida minor]
MNNTEREEKTVTDLKEEDAQTGTIEILEAPSSSSERLEEATQPVKLTFSTDRFKEELKTIAEENTKSAQIGKLSSYYTFVSALTNSIRKSLEIETCPAMDKALSSLMPKMVMLMLEEVLLLDKSSVTESYYYDRLSSINTHNALSESFPFANDLDVPSLVLLVENKINSWYTTIKKSNRVFLCEYFLHVNRILCQKRFSNSILNAKTKDNLNEYIAHLKNNDLLSTAHTKTSRDILFEKNKEGVYNIDHIIDVFLSKGGEVGDFFTGSKVHALPEITENDKKLLVALSKEWPLLTSVYSELSKVIDGKVQEIDRHYLTGVPMYDSGCIGLPCLTRGAYNEYIDKVNNLAHETKRQYKKYPYVVRKYIKEKMLDLKKLINPRRTILYTARSIDSIGSMYEVDYDGEWLDEQYTTAIEKRRKRNRMLLTIFTTAGSLLMLSMRTIGASRTLEHVYAAPKL